MPELPEVETTRRGIAPHVEGQTVRAVVVRQRRLRWPIPKRIEQLVGSRIERVERRAKYLLLRAESGTAISHLGMSGSLRIVGKSDPVRAHDHFDIECENGKILRFHDPRRFGSLLWTTDNPFEHKLLARLGPEPLGDEFDGAYLHRRSRKRSLAVKNFIMNNSVVVGVGNIYACEALFLCGIRPTRAAGKVSLRAYRQLAEQIRSVLSNAITVGGTTLRDFVNPAGEPGYFHQSLFVYGRAGEACKRCNAPIAARVIGQRNSFYCPHCQPAR